MSNAAALHLSPGSSRDYQALVLGRAGLDLYPQPDGGKTRDATSFSADMGGSAGNIAVAIAKAGARVGLISGLSKDAIGDFVRNRLVDYGVDVSLITTTDGNQRTSLAVAEVRNEDCEVVIYRNNPADLSFEITESVEQAVCNSSHLVITGTSLIDEDSRTNVFRLMILARQNHCSTWLDLDYRAWNWPGLELTRQVYREAAALSQVLIGNEEEFEVLSDDIEQLIKDCQNNNQILLLKRGANGSSLFAGKSRLDSGIFPLEPAKPYGAGDAFLGNLLVFYLNTGDWQQAISAGSAAAALVVSQRGCASAMPDADEIESLQREREMVPAALWR
jgi:5-dehydro-2-deoxygluconokinase